ncbi:hypothetical protein [Reichenbachiella ulvae]|uniref:Uncharacterized protein n=1 Tax=Reichenbachiella ulvae TaxID=2980104 RepID=A0ABT3CP82_9BACT|nr:hypothetical protein [Reichenbachiella ulvae]MCV9385381.1 hypothetical protein [Reichenbachiella ulvae]
MKRFLMMSLFVAAFTTNIVEAREVSVNSCLEDSSIYLYSSEEALSDYSNLEYNSNEDAQNNSSWASGVFPCVACVYLIMALSFLYWVCRYRWNW